ncbi:MAG: thioredoxin-dependent thiol peroxidase [Myxococcota bacterium]|nr:thioredoxin-dependent thiol peroxidase [Myxococcota bacterium]
MEAGDKAPTFKLPSTEGGEKSLKDYAGKKLVLYFYPKDATPGCTQEACDFRDNMARLKKLGVAVVGVSKDSLESHAKFRVAQKLPFELLSDADNAVAKAYNAYGEKNMYGKKVMGTIRTTVLIDEKGKVVQVWSPVKVPGHVEKVLEAISG